MQIIQTLPLVSQISLYVLLALMGLFSLLIFGWQIMILRGKAMQNPDGTSDDYHEQKTHFRIIGCPIGVWHGFAPQDHDLPAKDEQAK